jgi:5-methylcytosine-specific restriction endonuclease McrA
LARYQNNSVGFSILMLMIFLFVLSNFPILFVIAFIAFLLLMFILWIMQLIESRKKRLAHEARWTPEAVFERRLKDALRAGNYSTPRLEVGGAKSINGGFHGKIKTSTGIELWRCKHQHNLKSIKKRYGMPINRSLDAAKKCAQKELERNQSIYFDSAKRLVGLDNSGRNRSKLQETIDEQINHILMAFNGACAYCGVSGLRKGTIHQDHVVPLAKGGSNESSNMLPVCSQCNIDKGTKSVFQHLSELERKGIPLPDWVINAPTWQFYKQQESTS